MQAQIPIPARATPSSGTSKPSLLTTFSLVRRGGDLFRANKLGSPSTPTSTTTLASPVSVNNPHSPFVLLDALTLRLKANLNLANDDRASQSSIDVEEDDVEELARVIQETVEEGKKALAEHSQILLENPTLVSLQIENTQLASKLAALESIAAEYTLAAAQLKAARETIDAQAATIKEQALVNHDLFLVNDGLKERLERTERERDEKMRDAEILAERVGELEERAAASELDSAKLQSALEAKDAEVAVLTAANLQLTTDLASVRASDAAEIERLTEEKRNTEEELKRLKEMLEEMRYKESRKELFVNSVW